MSTGAALVFDTVTDVLAALPGSRLTPTMLTGDALVDVATLATICVAWGPLEIVAIASAWTSVGVGGLVGTT
jgi:hypothetical protein